VTVDLRGAMRSFATEVRTHLLVGDHTVAIGDMLATGTSRSVATGQPSLITNRCHKEYL
jgi:hypothetical protein